MKTTLFLCLTLSLLLFSCEQSVENESIPSLYDKTILYNPDLISFDTSIELGQSINDSISIQYVSSCFIRSYFTVTVNNDFEYNFTLKSIIKDKTNETHKCYEMPVISKAPFEFTPTKKGRYTMRIIGLKDTVTRYLEVK